MRLLFTLFTLILAAQSASAHGIAVVRARVFSPFQPFVRVQAVVAQPVVFQQHAVVQQVVTQPVFVQQAFAVRPVFAFSAFGHVNAFQRFAVQRVFQPRVVIQRNVFRVR